MPLSLNLDSEFASFASDQRSPEDLLKDVALNLVADFHNYPPAYDEPRLYHIVATIPSSLEIDDADFGEIREDDPDTVAIVGGCSLDRTRALWKALGEALEREALTYREGLPIAFGTYREFAPHALDPNGIPAGTARCAVDRQGMKMGWVKALALPAKALMWVPAQLVYVPYLFGDGEAVIRAPMSTGAAAGSTGEAATFAALAEAVERDAFMVSWLKQLPLIRMDVSDGLDSPRASLFEKTIHKFNRYNLQPEFYLLATDMPLYVVMCVLWDTSAVGPPVSVGAKATTSLTDSCLGALEEAHQLRPWLRSLLSADPSLRQTPYSLHPSSLLDRAKLWLSDAAIIKLRQWLTLALMQRIPPIRPPKTIAELVEAIRQAGCTTYFVDLSAQKVLDLGFSVARVIIPELQPLYLDEELPDLAWSRLEILSKRPGLESRIEPGKAETFPHPFL